MIRVLSRAAAVSLALAVSGGALAQQPARPAQPATPAQPPAAPVSASHLALARDVVVASGITRTFEVIPAEMNEQLKKNSVTRPELVKDLSEVLEQLKPEMELQKQQMVNTAARIYAAKLTEPELKEVVAFFKSPVGVRYVQTQPQLLDEMVIEIQNWTKQLSEYVMVRVRAEMAKRGRPM